VQLAQETEQFSFSRYTEARANLLPNFDGSVSEQNQTVNPRALGVRFDNPAFVLPKEVGPFYTFDARIHYNQNLLNLTGIRHLQAARADVRAAKGETDSVREQVAGHVARLYAAGLRADAQVEAAKANLTDAESLLEQASHRASAGEGTELDIARAKLSVARDRQRELAAETERRRTQLELIKVLHLDWSTNLRLTGNLAGAPAQTLTVDEWIATALSSRADFKVQQERTESARLNQSAAQAERMPSLAGYGDYGVLEGAQTHTLGAALRVPLFDGGRMGSDRRQAVSQLHQEQIRAKELRNQVELEIRQALASLDSTGQQIMVAEQAIAVAEEELGSARRRYDAGVTNSQEVVDAQTQLAIVRNDRVAALFSYASARIDLAQATGTVVKAPF
jgi:outer membrane protein TolC